MKKINLLLAIALIVLAGSLFALQSQATETTWRHSGFEVWGYDLNFTDTLNITNLLNLDVHDIAVTNITATDISATTLTYQNGPDGIYYNGSDLNTFLTANLGYGTRIQLGCNNFTISQTINISDSNIDIIGCGGGSMATGGNPESQAPSFNTQIYWTGSADGTMISITPDATHGSGNYTRSINLAGISFNGNNLASTGISATSIVDSHWSNIGLFNITSTQLSTGSLVFRSGDGGTTTIKNVRRNIFSDIHIVQASTSTTPAIIFEHGTNLVSNINENEFIDVWISYYGYSGWYLNSSDNNRWFGGGGNSLGATNWKLFYTPSTPLYHGGNIFYGVMGTWNYTNTAPDITCSDYYFGIATDETDINNVISVSNVTYGRTIFSENKNALYLPIAHNSFDVYSNLNTTKAGFKFGRDDTTFVTAELYRDNSNENVYLYTPSGNFIVQTFTTADNDFIVDSAGDVIILKMAGTGQDYLCVDANGKLVRSDAAC